MSNQPLGLPGHWPMTAACVLGRNAVRVWIGSLPARPTGLQLGIGLTRSPPSSCHELLHVEDSPSDEHVIGRPSDLVCEDRQRLSLSVLALELFEQALTFGVFSKEQDGGLGEGPLEMGVADLPPARAETLAGGFPGALDEAGVGGEVLDRGEAVDVVDLVEDRQGEDLADAGQGLEMEEAAGVVLLDGLDDVQLELANEPVVDFGEGEVSLDTLANAGVGKLLGNAITVAPIDDPSRRLGQVVLVVRILNVGEELATLA